MAVAGDGRPFPPGEYGVVVVGTGPGGLQTSYALARLGIDHALLSADDGPGGMFRTFPLFERLISWTHDAEPGEQETRAYETHDQNSLVADEPELRGLVIGKMADGRRRPARDEMEAGLVEFAERGGIRARYACRWEATRRNSNIVVTTGDGDYHSRAVVFAIGATEPWVPPIPGLELDHHYASLEDAPDRFRGRRVVIVGKRNSAFEVGEALLRRGVRELTLVSPRPPDMARLARSPLRPWYLTPYDEHVRGAPGRYVLDASIDRVERTESGYRVHALDPTRADPLVLDADVVVAATGFRAPLADLRELGVATVADGRLPALTPYWESVTVPGIFFAGNVTQAAAGLRKHGVASLSSMVCGFRYNARLLVGHLAEAVFGRSRERPRLAPERAVPYLIAELNGAPELAMQKGYLARVLRPHSRGGLADEGIVPLEVFVDAAYDGVAVTLEFDAEERIHPALYVRRRGVLDEVVMPPHPLRRYEDADYRGPIEAGLAPFLA